MGIGNTPAKTWWNGVGPMPDDERETLVANAIKTTPGMTRDKALRTIAILENFDGIKDLEWLAAMQKQAADA